MSKIGKEAEDIINRSPFIREAITENLINISALARKIKPEIEEKMGAPVNEGAIVMAIKRMAPGYYHKINVKINKFMSDLGDFLVRSDLTIFTFDNSPSIPKLQSSLMDEIANERDIFYTVSRGVTETTIITGQKLTPRIQELFANEILKSHKENLASVTIKLDETNTEISGIYYYFLKHLAWEGINILEVISTTNEITFVVEGDLVDQAFSVLMRLKIRN
ncbi:MAG: aspartate kinase [Crocinitomicaceae bacterium]